MGVWIEIFTGKTKQENPEVTPCVGVWIEIRNERSGRSRSGSLPAWECGLKSTTYPVRVGPSWVTPCVGVRIEMMISDFSPSFSVEIKKTIHFSSACIHLGSYDNAA